MKITENMGKDEKMARAFMYLERNDGVGDPIWEDKDFERAVFDNYPSPLIEITANAMGALCANHTGQTVRGWRSASGWTKMTRDMVKKAENNGFKPYEPSEDNTVWPLTVDGRWVVDPYTQLINFAFRKDWPHSHLIEILLLQIWDLQYRSHLMGNSDSCREASQKAATMYSAMMPISPVAQGQIVTNYNFGRDIARSILLLAE
jgi:hypothetical protein